MLMSQLSGDLIAKATGRETSEHFPDSEKLSQKEAQKHLQQVANIIDLLVVADKCVRFQFPEEKGKDFYITEDDVQSLTGKFEELGGVPFKDLGKYLRAFLRKSGCCSLKEMVRYSIQDTLIYDESKIKQLGLPGPLESYLFLFVCKRG